MTDADLPTGIQGLSAKRWSWNARQVVLLAGLLIPFVAFGRSVWRYAVNIPIQDDFDVALSFINSFNHAKTATNHALLIFNQHNEHRIIFCRLAFLANYYLLHKINFRDCIIFGDLGWISTVALLMWIFHKNFHLSLLQLMPIPFFLLSLTHTENMFFAMAAIVNYWFMFFSIAFLHCLSRYKSVGIFALFPIAFFSSGGGVALAVVGNLFLAARRKWKLFWMFFGFSAVCATAYFVNYIEPKNQPKIPASAGPQPFRAISYAFVYMGNIWSPTFGNLTDVALSSAAGLILLAISIYILVKRGSDNFLILTLSFVLVIALAAAATRSGFGVSQALSSRYSMYPLLALVCIYVYASRSIRLDSHAVSGVSIAFVTLISFVAVGYWWAFASLNETKIADTREKRIAIIEAFQTGDTDDLNELYHPSAQRAAKILLNAQTQGIYDYQNFGP